LGACRPGMIFFVIFMLVNIGSRAWRQLRPLFQ
jgi:hypothetical protein